MKAGVITFPGSNCDGDAVFALSQTGFTVDTLWHKDTPSLGAYDLVVLPGGFSYGDYLRCGAVASLSPIMESVRPFAENGGLVLGICNGFQILCEAGLLPGALARNSGLQFICRDVVLKVENPRNPWTGAYRGTDTIKIPIAHGDGRYVVDEKTYEKLAANQQILFRYADNPNGSVHDIAGVCNEAGNVLGMMPHPERATDLRSQDGKRLWNSVATYLKEKRA